MGVNASSSLMSEETYISQGTIIKNCLYFNNNRLKSAQVDCSSAEYLLNGGLGKTDDAFPKPAIPRGLLWDE